MIPNLLFTSIGKVMCTVRVTLSGKMNDFPLVFRGMVILGGILRQNPLEMLEKCRLGGKRGFFTLGIRNITGLSGKTSKIPRGRKMQSACPRTQPPATRNTHRLSKKMTTEEKMQAACNKKTPPKKWKAFSMYWQLMINHRSYRTKCSLKLHQGCQAG